MLKRTSLWLDTKTLSLLAQIGRKLGDLKVSQVIRIAVQEYLDKRTKEEKS